MQMLRPAIYAKFMCTPLPCKNPISVAQMKPGVHVSEFFKTPEEFNICLKKVMINNNGMFGLW